MGVIFYDNKLIKYDKNNREIYSRDSTGFEEARNYLEDGRLCVYQNSDDVEVQILYVKRSESCYMTENYIHNRYRTKHVEKEIADLRYNSNTCKVSYIFN